MKTHLETHLTSPNQHLEPPQQPSPAQPVVRQQATKQRHKCATCSDVFATAQELASHSRTHVPSVDEVCVLVLCLQKNIWCFFTVPLNFQNQNEKQVSARQSYFSKKTMYKSSLLVEKVFHFSSENGRTN